MKEQKQDQKEGRKRKKEKKRMRKATANLREESKTQFDKGLSYRDLPSTLEP